MMSFLNNFLLLCDFCKPLKHSLFCDPQTSSLHLKDHLNTCSDRLFKVIGGFLAENVEPLELPDLSSGFNYTLLMTYYGDINLTGGSLQNLSSVKHAKFGYYKTSRKTGIILPLTFDALSFTYNYSAAILGFGRSGTVFGIVQGLKMELVLGYVYQKPEITFDCRATDLEYFDLEFDGNYLIDWILNLLGDILITVLRGHILTSVENAVKEEADEYITEINRIITEYQSSLLPLFFKKLLQESAKP
ncbi:hypothetical protein Zmor_012782 [Zophobas morio]|uniref:Uncharacterized protein n=1 Tax=Zophobas morio TaxID=2755281 RepID=A0AA38IBU9_9CUCU|nr:hypothetical protein Zmor_012782 [Zophobas morio]